MRVRPLEAVLPAQWLIAKGKAALAFAMDSSIGQVNALFKPFTNSE
jgi:hypothetical protein